MEKSTFEVTPFIKKEKVNLGGTVPIYVRITINKQAKQFSTKLRTTPDMWDIVNKKVFGKTEQAVNVNKSLKVIESIIYKIYRELVESESYITAERVANVFLGIETRQNTFLKLFSEQNAKSELKNTKSTVQKYQRYYKHVESFLIKERNIRDIAVKEIDEEFVSNLEDYLLTTAKCNRRNNFL